MSAVLLFYYVWPLKLWQEHIGFLLFEKRANTMSFASVFVGGLFTAGETLAEEAELPGLVTALKAAGFASDEAFAFAEENPVEAMTGLILGVAAVTLLGPELLAAGAAAIADTALMEEGATAIGLLAESAGLSETAAAALANQAINIASTVIVEGAIGLSTELAYKALYNGTEDVVQSLGGTLSSSTTEDSGQFSILPSSNPNSPAAVLPGTSISLGLALQNFSDGTSQVTSLSSDGTVRTDSYSGRNGTGNLTASDIEDPNGTSEIITYDSRGDAIETGYSGPNGTGATTGTTISVKPVSQGQQVFSVTFASTEFNLPPTREGSADTTSSLPVILVSGKGSVSPGAFGETVDQNYYISQLPYPGEGLGFGVNSEDITLKGYNNPGDYQGILVPLEIYNYTGSGITFNLTINQKVYSVAQDSTKEAGSLISELDFGIVHVGESTSESVTVSNTAAGSLGDSLGTGAIIDTPNATNPFAVSGGSGDLAAGASETLTFTVDSSQAGAVFGYQTFISHDSDLPDVPAIGELALEAQVNNYAVPAFEIDNNGYDVTPGETLQHSGNSWTINLGEVDRSGASVAILVQNSAAAPGDNLSGGFDVSGDGFDTQNTNFFANVSPGQSAYDDVYVTADASTPGAHTETIVLHPVGSNAGGYSGALPDQTLTVEDVVAAPDTLVVSGDVQTISDPSELMGINEIDLQHGGTADFSADLAALAPALTIDFLTQDDKVSIDSPSSFGTNVGSSDYTGPLFGNFSAGDSIDLKGLPYVTGTTSLNYTVSTGILQITDGTETASLAFGAGNDIVDDPFHLNPDSTGGTVLTNDASPPCYCPGTLILTPHGEIPVEELAIGDLVTTLSGAARPIKWIGRRSYSGRFVLGRTDILPIRISRGALDQNIPRRDLLVSPNHALFLENALIEARDLVNDVSITQAESAESVVYIHIELDTHDVILAEGAPAESFIDDDDRGLFHNAHEYRALYADQVREPARYCAPRLKDGHVVEAARRRIDGRAGIAAPEGAKKLALRGYIDIADGQRVAGWAQNADYPEAPVCLDIRVDGNLIGQTLANRYRSDLAWAGLGSGRHGFVFALPVGVVASPGNVDVRRSLDGKTLPLSASMADANEAAPVSAARYQG